MNFKKFISIFTLVFSFCSIFAQSDNATLFTVGNQPVDVSEFKYIYGKTNGEKADYSKKSIEEYLDLYVKFKRKVLRAREMQLDTIATLKEELDGYRQQLANSYLVDKEITDKLVEEAYNRMQKDVEIAHIMFSLPRDASPEDTLKTYQKAMDLKRAIDSGKATWKEAVRANSDDASTKEDEGRIGYITAMLPDGFYELENATYSTPRNATSLVRSDLGYHLVKTLNERPARGEMEAAHILIRTDDKTIGDAKIKIDEVYQRVLKGEDFAAVAQQVSDDVNSASKGGEIGFFGINRYEKSFEDAAFALQKDGDVSAPFATSVGYHIVKRLARRAVEPFDVAKKRLKARIQNNSRYNIAIQSMVRKVLKEVEFVENRPILDEFASVLTEDFLSYKWNGTDIIDKQKKVLFTFKKFKKDYTLQDYVDFLNKSIRKRLSYSGTKSPQSAAVDLYKDFVNSVAMKYEESQLDKKYPEFKYLMKEYEEGILLFEATRNLVWDKASKDTVGLDQFYKTIKGKYMWDERATLNAFTVTEAGKDKLESIKKYAATKTYDKVLKKFNKKGEIVKVSSKTIEKKDRNKMPELVSIDWAAGKVSETKMDEASKTASFIKIEKLIPPTEKKLNEAKGYIVAEYQEYLEKKWLEDLEKSYPAKVNDEVLKSIIK